MHPFRYRRIDLYSCQRATLHWKRNWNFELGPKSTVRDNRTFSAATAARGLRFSEFFRRSFLQFGSPVIYIYNSTHVARGYFAAEDFFRFFSSKIADPTAVQRHAINQPLVPRGNGSHQSTLNWTGYKSRWAGGLATPGQGFKNTNYRQKWRFCRKIDRRGPIGPYILL